MFSVPPRYHITVMRTVVLKTSRAAVRLIASYNIDNIIIYIINYKKYYRRRDFLVILKLSERNPRTFGHFILLLKVILLKKVLLKVYWRGKLISFYFQKKQLINNCDRPASRTVVRLVVECDAAL